MLGLGLRALGAQFERQLGLELEAHLGAPFSHPEGRSCGIICTASSHGRV